MPEEKTTDNAEKPKQKNLNDPEISRLREVVLSWVEKAKRMNPSIDDLKIKKKKKKEKVKKEEDVIEIHNPIAKVEAVHAPKAKIPPPVKPEVIQPTPPPKVPPEVIQPTPPPKVPPEVIQPTPPPAKPVKIIEPQPIINNSKNPVPVKLEIDEVSKKLKKPKVKIKEIPRPVFGGKGKPKLKRIPAKKSLSGGNTIIRKSIYAILILAVAGLVILSSSIYIFGAKNSTVMAITKFIPLPVAGVDLKLISYHSWRVQIDTLENFYQKQSEANPSILLPTPEQTEQHILERMIDNAVLNKAAKKYKIRTTPEEAEDYLKVLVAEIGSQEAFESQIKDLYNWSVEDFTKEIVEPLLIKTQLAMAIMLDDRINEKARLIAQQALNEVRAAQLPFESLAQKYSEDITAVQGGDLGYFSKGQLEPAFEEAAFALKPGEVSDLVQTRYGFHIIKVEEALVDENDEVIQIRAKHILIRGKDLDSYLNEIKQDSTIWRLISI